MNDIFSRNIMYWGENVQQELSKKHVFVFGLGGVGGYCAEALARAGIGELTIVDFDGVSKSNINRQLVALHSTIGIKKTDLFEQRLKDINPNIKINAICDFYSKEKEEVFFKNIKPDCVIDAIDTMRAKVDLLTYCSQNKIPTATSLGAGNRIDPTQLYACDISEIDNIKCDFTKNVLHNLKKNGIEKGIISVLSKEKAKKPLIKVQSTINLNNSEIKKFSPSSSPFVPPVAGYILAFECLRLIIKNVDK